MWAVTSDGASQLFARFSFGTIKGIKQLVDELHEDTGWNGVSGDQAFNTKIIFSINGQTINN